MFVTNVLRSGLIGRGISTTIRPKIIQPISLIRFLHCSSIKLKLNHVDKVEKIKPTSINSQEQIEINPIELKSTLESIPGEKPLRNDPADRVPKFPLSREAAPTLIPRPGVPRAGVNGMTFGKMINILESKPGPELIYELEPHRLYFVICGCFALVFAFYAWNIGMISFGLAWNIFQENNLELPVVHKYINTGVQFGIAAVLTSMPLLVMLVFIMAPTRLIRRMWYVPGKEEYVQFITHPLIPSKNAASPVISIPLQSLNRAHKSKVWTGRGFYGTIDSTIFFFLREKNSRIPWIVDRKGFFWGDGRVFDYLFGKETIEELERGLTLNEKAEILAERIKKGEKELKKQLGVGWRYKAQGKLLKEDILKLQDIVTGGDTKKLKGNSDNKQLPKS